MLRNLADELLQGAIDMHCHAYPEFSMEFPCRYTPDEHIQMMIDCGMGGVVLKSHVWPTMGLVSTLKRQFPDFTIVGSITLNDGVGGMAPWVVESAAKQNARVVWFPTWSAHNDIERGGISKLIGSYVPSFQDCIDQGGRRMTNDDGGVRKEVMSVLEVCRDYDMVTCTGHISPVESIAVARAAADIGLKKLILSHPDSGSVKATIEQMSEFSRYGGYIELCALGLTPIHHRITPSQLKNIVQMVSAEKCVMSTDYFFAWDSASPELMRSLISALLYVGVTAEAIRTINRETPQMLLNIK